MTTSRSNPVLSGTFVHIPYDMFDKHLPFFRRNKLNPEIYFGSRSFDDMNKDDIIGLKKKLDYNPDVTIHAPFMDLSPGAVDLQVREVTLRRYFETLDAAEILMPRAIVFHSGYDRWKYDERVDIWLENSLKTWGPVNKRAAEMGVKIAIENIFEDDPENLILLSKEMNSDNFGICFDTGHFNLFSKLPLAEWLSLIKPYIVELHLHDNLRYADQHLAIGDGDFDFAGLFKEIKEIECIYTIEAHTEENAAKSLEQLKQYIT